MIALACVLASASRLARAVSPTHFDIRLLDEAIAGDARTTATGERPVRQHGPAAEETLQTPREAEPGPRVARLADALEASGDADWEREVLDALNEPEPAVREARWGEALTEFEGRALQWAAVPRVCASLATSAGFLFGSLALIDALRRDDPLPGGAGVISLIVGALNCLALGMAAASFCAAAHVRAKRVARDRLDGAWRLVDRLRHR